VYGNCFRKRDKSQNDFSTVSCLRCVTDQHLFLFINCGGINNPKPLKSDPDYMSAPFEQSVDFAAEYRCSQVVECNNGNLGAGYKSVEIDLEDSNRLGVERATNRWDPAEPDN